MLRQLYLSVASALLLTQEAMADDTNKGFQLKLTSSDTTSLAYTYETNMKILNTDGSYSVGPVMPSLTSPATMITSAGCVGCSDDTFDSTTAASYT